MPAGRWLRSEGHFYHISKARACLARLSCATQASCFWSLACWAEKDALGLHVPKSPVAPPALFCIVSRLNCFSGVRLPLAACESPCVCFQTVVRSSAPAAGVCACPSVRQHSGLGGWLDLAIQFFRSEFLFMFSCGRA